MKKNILFCALLLSTASTFAQCDGERYLNRVFTSIIDTQNIIYSNSNGATGLRMDVYEPAEDPSTRRPLIIFAHGGSFVAGDENVSDIVQFCQRFAKHGYVTASIQYRLAQFTDLADSTKMIETVVKALHDMKAAVRYFRNDAATANRFRIDPNMIFVGGASAGAILAVHLTYLTDLAELPDHVVQIVNENGGTEGNSGYPGYSSEVAGVINFCGGINQAQWIDAGEKPIVSIHGTSDGTVPYGHGEVLQSNPISQLFTLVTLDGSSIIHARAEEVGLYNALWSIPNEDHMAHASAAHIDESESFVANFLHPIVCSSVGIEQPTPESSVQIQPNPNQGSFSVVLPQQLQGECVITLTDLSGRVINQNTYNANNGSPINLTQANLNAGLYLLHIQGKQQVNTVRVLVER